MRKRRTGNSRRRALAVALLAAALPLWAGPKKHPNRAADDYAVVAGTVFRESGLSLAGAEVEIVAAASPAGLKFKRQQAVSDGRGEFAFRVPAATAKYRVSAKARGYSPAGKEVSVVGFERVDVFLILEPASKK